MPDTSSLPGHGGRAHTDQGRYLGHMADPGDSLMPEDPPVPPDSLRTAATLMRRVERATGGRGACVGRPMLLGEPEPHAGRGHALDPVVALVPAAMGYAEAAGRLRSLVADGVDVGAVLVSTDEGVLVANRTDGDPPAGRPVQRGGGARSRPPPAGRLPPAPSAPPGGRRPRGTSGRRARGRCAHGRQRAGCGPDGGPHHPGRAARRPGGRPRGRHHRCDRPGERGGGGRSRRAADPRRGDDARRPACRGGLDQAGTVPAGRGGTAH